MNILDIAIAKKLAGGGGGSGTDNYNDLSNLPKINDTTLSGNKSSSALGLQSEINSDSKLASDLVDDTNQDNKFVTSTEKNTWNGKQNAIDADHKINADYVDDSTSTNKFVTASDKETWNAKQNAIDNSHKLSSDLVDDANKTNKFVTSTEKNTWNAKQNAIDSDHKLSSSLVSFTDAEAAALASGIDSSKVGQISTNQTNILYGLNTGVKNKLPCAIANINQPSDTGISCKYNDDGSYTITGTKLASDSYLDLGVIRAENLVGSHYASITSTGTGSIQLAAYGWNGTGYTLMLTTSTAQGFSVGNYTLILVRLRFMGSVNTSFNAVVKPMICTEDAWNQSTDFMPPALPNYDLTYLESQDRAALAEEIDAGAKNLLKRTASGSSWTDDNVTFTLNSDGSITINSSGAITANRFFAYFEGRMSDLVSTAGNYVLFASASPNNQAQVWWYYTDDWTNVIETSGNSSRYISASDLNRPVIVRIRALTGNAISNVKVYPMVCTKAAFGVSNKFVPYRPNYDLVVSKLPVAKSTNYTITAADTWQEVEALRLTVPTGKIVSITVGQTYSNAKPTGVEVCVENNSDKTKSVVYFEDTSTYTILSASGVYNNTSGAPKTLYVFIRSSATGTNTVTLCYQICN